MNDGPFLPVPSAARLAKIALLACVALLLVGLPTPSIHAAALPRAAVPTDVRGPSPSPSVVAHPANLISYRSGTPFNGGGYGVAFDAYHNTFDVASTSGLQVVNEGTWTSAGSVSLPLGSYCRVVVDSARQLAFVSGGNNGEIYIVNTTSLGLVGTITTSGGAQGMAVDPSRTLLVYTDTVGVRFYDYATLALVATVTAPGPTRVAIDPVHQVVAAGSPGSKNLWLINETTHQWIGNRSIISSALPITFVPGAQSFVAGSNGNDQFSVVPDTTVGSPGNGTIPLMTTLQDMTPVGGGTDEVLVWGISELAVVAANNLSVLQNVVPAGGTSFPYGIAIDPTTEVALGVDPSLNLATPFVPSISSVPSAPSSVTLTPANNTVVVRWGASLAYLLTNYSVQYGSSPTSLTHQLSVGSSTRTTDTFPWPDGSSVYATVTAWNGTVPSPPSSPVASTVPRGVPYPPQNVTASAVGSSSAEVQWDPPAHDDGSALTFYQVGLRAASGSPWSYVRVPASATLEVVGNLSAGVAYELNVSAINAAGDGNSSAPVTVTIPPAPSPSQLPPLLSTLTSYPGVLLLAAVLVGVVLLILLLVARSRRRGKFSRAPPSSSGGGQAAPPAAPVAPYGSYPPQYAPPPYGGPPYPPPP